MTPAFLKAAHHLTVKLYALIFLLIGLVPLLAWEQMNEGDAAGSNREPLRSYRCTFA